MIDKRTLSNGVRIVTEKIPGVRSVAIGIWVKVGSREEHTEINGISHFIEHLMFKGTKNRTPKQLAEELDVVGGQLNAFTSKECTCYYARVLDEHVDLALDVLSDMFFNSLFKEEEINKERNVVLEEIKMYEDAPDDLVHDLVVQGLLKEHPIGRPILGTYETVSKISRQQIIDYLNKTYVPTNVVVVLAGNIDNEKITNKVDKIFAQWQGEQTERTAVRVVPKYNIVTKKKEIEQVHLNFAYPALPQDHTDSYVLHCINSVLGGGLSSRLFQSIREDRGLAYSVYSYTSSYSDTGLFGIYAGLSEKNLQEVMSLIRQELKSVKDGGLTEAELLKAKQQLKGSMFLGLESVSSRMSRLGKSEVTLNRIVTVEEIVKRIDSVTLEDTIRVAQHIFNDEQVCIAAIGANINNDIVNQIMGAS